MVCGDVDGASQRIVKPGKRAKAGIVNYVRYVKLERDGENGDPCPPEPEELTDHLLMQFFPGRFLEEIDQIDTNRLLRALEARRMDAAEDRRKLFVAGKLEAKDISAVEWELITEMDEIANELGL